MSEQTPAEGCKEATVEELCESALKHYDDLSTRCSHWHNQVPQAIRYWYLERPKVERELSAALKRAEENERDARRYRRVREEMNNRKWRHTFVPQEWCPEEDDEDSITTYEKIDAAIDAAIAGEGKQ